ncbi:MAG: hypothetical protein ACO28Q_07985 [Ilumatobacteraceae bacterium]|jgi:hypothetical protein
MRSRNTWITWLTVVLTLVLAYAVLLVVAGSAAGSLFEWFGFGPDDAIDTPEVREYLELPYMVLGAVMAGWAVLMLQIVRGPLRDGAPWATRIIGRALVLWFVLDTGMSLVLGFPTHALFNIPFAIALGVPLLKLRSQPA